MDDIERERVFLLKELPKDLLEFKHIDIKIGDVTLSNDVNVLKIRQKGDKYEIIRKEYISEQEKREFVVPLSAEEFALLFPVTKRRHAKKRFFYPLDKYVCEVDMYEGDMEGYARAEVEFDTTDEFLAFNPPSWFGEEITAINHEIHENLGEITCDTMEKRYKERGITFKRMYLPKI
ncbi:MAG: hypothetical protein WBC29_01245 [Candidatus Moraniibacteriota bacterium]